MDQEELDEWYDDEKEKLTERYEKKLKDYDKKLLEKKKKIKPKESDKKEEGKVEKDDPLKKQQKLMYEKFKQNYLKKMKKLHKDYDNKAKKLLGSGLRKHFLKHRFNMIKKRILKPWERYKEDHFKKKEKEEE